MNGFSRVFMIGYVGSDPELHTSKNGAPYVKLHIATHRSRKLEDGKWESSTEWHKVMVWGPRAEMCSRNLMRGSPIAVEGHLETYRYEAEAGPVTQVTVVASQIHFLPNPKQQNMDFTKALPSHILDDVVAVHQSA